MCSVIEIGNLKRHSVEIKSTQTGQTAETSNTWNVPTMASTPSHRVLTPMNYNQVHSNSSFNSQPKTMKLS